MAYGSSLVEVLGLDAQRIVNHAAGEELQRGENRDKNLHILIITGLLSRQDTGNERLEDMEYYCVDNLPPVL